MAETKALTNEIRPMDLNFLNELRENVFKITSSVAGYETSAILDNAHKLFEQCKGLRRELEHVQKEKHGLTDKYEGLLKSQAERLKSEYDAKIKMMHGARTVVQEYPGNRSTDQMDGPDAVGFGMRFAQWLDDHPDAGPTYKKLFQEFLNTLPQANV